MNSPDAANPKQKYLQPELYFVKKSVKVGDPDSDEKVTVSQFIRKGTVLADFPTFIKLKRKGFLRSSIEPGENTELLGDGYTLIANASGYPKALFLEQESGPDILTVSITPLVKISHNRLQATLVLHPAIPEAPSLKTENLAELITEAGVVYGIDQAAIAKAEEMINSSVNDFEEIPFAKGELPGEGTNASLRFELEIGPLAGHRLEDGTIDFRDRKIMVGVNKGQHIATKIPAVAGIPGHNVLGEEIEPKTGKDIKIRVVGDTEFLPEENIIIASKDGALSVVNNETIKVSSRSTITGDVDYKTGNIESENHTTIRGSVLPGFKVNVGGDLEIIGAVSAASVHCGGNGVIKGGITGQSSIITSDGDLDIKFIERGAIKSSGIVVIRKQCYYSSVEAKSDIRCHQNCTIMGGSILAGGNLTVGDVGADNCEPAILAAGVDPERYHLYLELQQELSEQQEEIIQTLQRLGRGARSKKIKKMEEVVDQTKLKILKLNLIPGTELYSRVGKGKDREEMDDEDPLYQTGIEIEKIRVEVRGTVYAGTKILVGNRSAVLSQNVQNRRYRLSKNLKRIMAIPL